MKFDFLIKKLNLSPSCLPAVKEQDFYQMVEGVKAEHNDLSFTGPSG